MIETFLYVIKNKYEINLSEGYPERRDEPFNRSSGTRQRMILLCFVIRKH